MYHGWFPTGKVLKLIFVCFQLQSFITMQELAALESDIRTCLVFCYSFSLGRVWPRAEANMVNPDDTWVLKWPFIRQPDSHIGWATSTSFVSINHIFMEFNSWKFGKRTIHYSPIHKTTFYQFTITNSSPLASILASHLH